jgi:DNA-binding CsgD family transcriptional regulator
MMIATQTLKQLVDGDEPPGLPHVISEFDIKDVHYLVLAIGDYSVEQNVNEILIPFLEGFKASSFSAVDQFNLNDQCCLIVEIRTHSDNDQADLVALLTARELQIATLVAQGYPNKKVAKQLHISEWTVATHIRRIFAKLHVDSRAAMVFRCASLIRNIQNPRYV